MKVSFCLSRSRATSMAKHFTAVVTHSLTQGCCMKTLQLQPAVCLTVHFCVSLQSYQCIEGRGAGVYFVFWEWGNIGNIVQIFHKKEANNNKFTYGISVLTLGTWFDHFKCWSRIFFSKYRKCLVTVNKRYLFKTHQYKSLSHIFLTKIYIQYVNYLHR